MLVLAVRNRDVRAINDAVRSYLREHDQHRRRRNPRRGRRARPAFAAGDEVVITRNDYRRDLLNGTRARVLADRPAAPAADLAQPRRRTGRRRHRLVGRRAARPRLRHDLPPRPRHYRRRRAALRHGALSREHAYVALSRGRHANYLYATHEELRGLRRVRPRRARATTLTKLTRARGAKPSAMPSPAAAGSAWPRTTGLCRTAPELMTSGRSNGQRRSHGPCSDIHRCPAADFRRDLAPRTRRSLNQPQEVTP